MPVFFFPTDIHEERAANNPSIKKAESYESGNAQYDAKPTFIKLMCSHFQPN